MMRVKIKNYIYITAVRNSKPSSVCPSSKQGSDQGMEDLQAKQQTSFKKLLSPAPEKHRFLIQLNSSLRRLTNSSKHLCGGWVSLNLLLSTVSSRTQPDSGLETRAKHTWPKIPSGKLLHRFTSIITVSFAEGEKETAVHGECPRVSKILFKSYECWKKDNVEQLLTLKSKFVFKLVRNWDMQIKYFFPIMDLRTPQENWLLLSTSPGIYRSFPAYIMELTVFLP